MSNKTTFALSAALTLAASAAWATDAPKSYTEQATSPSLLLAMASPAIASAQRDAGKNSSNGMDLGTDGSQDSKSPSQIVQPITCGYPHQCVIALPKDLSLKEDPTSVVPQFLKSGLRVAGDRNYVIVSLYDAEDAPNEASLVLFTDNGPYFFMVSRNGDQIDHYVELN